MSGEAFNDRPVTSAAVGVSADPTLRTDPPKHDTSRRGVAMGGRAAEEAVNTHRGDDTEVAEPAATSPNERPVTSAGIGVSADDTLRIDPSNLGVATSGRAVVEGVAM